MQPTLIARARRCALSALLALTACASAPPPRPDHVAPGDLEAVRGYARALIRHEMAQAHVQGLGIALADDHGTLWAEGFGDADRERGQAADGDTLYRVGSISKLFTDAAAMQLVEQGRFDLDAPIGTYLPGFALRSSFPGSRPITARLLMTHHAGLPRDLGKGFMTPHPRPFEEVVPALAGLDAAFAPGEALSYSNLGLSVLGSALERAAGEPYAQHLRQALLQPLGMDDATVEPGPAASPRMAHGYRDGKPAEDPPLRDVPAGGLNASAAGVARFLTMMLARGEVDGHRILLPESVDEMLRAQNAGVPLDLDVRVGLGWMLSAFGQWRLDGAGTVAHHAGATDLFHAQLYLLPDQRLGVVVLANSAEAGRVVEHVAAETLALALEARTGHRANHPPPVPKAERPATAEERADFTGDYTTLAGPVHISAQGERLRARALGHDFDLRPRTDGSFGLSHEVLGLFPVDLGMLGEIGFRRRMVAGRELLVGKVGGREIRVGERLPAPPPSPAWRARLGRYVLLDGGEDHRFVDAVELAEDGGFLLLRFHAVDALFEQHPVIVQPLSDDEAWLLQDLAGRGERLRWSQESGEDRLWIAGYTFARQP